MSENEDILDTLLMEANEEDLLDNLLSAANEESKNNNGKVKEISLFDKESDIEEPTDFKTSVLHYGNADSSDDEEYNKDGRKIKQLLHAEKVSQSSGCSSVSKFEQNSFKSSWKCSPKNNLSVSNNKPKQNTGDVYTDPVFGLRIINPLISSKLLQERMVGREAVPFSRLQKFIQVTKDKDWVIAGVLANKSAVKVSQKGSQFSIWTLSDLKNDIKTVSVFLFGSAYKQLWKTSVGTVVGMLNPNVMDKKSDSKDEACLSIDNAQKALILGQSKDLGTCKSSKKNGEQCNAIVNVNLCQYCVYHIKQEYAKCSKRSELQANFAGKGLTALRNKVLGKNEVFYAGKSYTAITATKSKRIEKEDRGRLKSLSGSIDSPAYSSKITPFKKKKEANQLEVSTGQRLKDLQLLKKLGCETELHDFSGQNTQKSVSILPEKPEPIKIATENSKKENEKSSGGSSSMHMDIPLLSGNSIIDLNKPITSRHKDRVKQNAIKFIQRNGPIKRVDPNNTKGTKRKIENINFDANLNKKVKIEDTGFISDRFKKMMAQTSKHMDLLDQRDEEEKEKYFNKLEVKEKMEEKMVNTFKVACKAVTCTICKYTSFSASEQCKAERHPLKVFDAIKRFFKCGNCGYRTASLKIVPVKPCTNCESMKWEKTGMMKEKTVVPTPALCIRGGEEKFISSVSKDSNINLLVPDE